MYCRYPAEKREVSMVEKIMEKLNSSFEENIRYMNEILPVKESFDIIRREIIIGGKASVFYYIDGFIKDEAMLRSWTPFFLYPNRICRKMQKCLFRNMFLMWK